MLMEVLAEAAKAGEPSLAPKEVRAAIKEKFDFDVRSEYMSTTMWRLADRGKLQRTDDGRYGLLTAAQFPVPSNDDLLG